MPVPQQSRSQQIAAIAVVALLALAGWAAIAPRPPAPRPAVLSADTPRASSQRCAECHFDTTDAFSSSPHARTLHRMNDTLARRFAGRSFRGEASGAEFRYEMQDETLVVSTPAYAQDLPIQWVFGSGTHAQTPLILLDGVDGRQRSVEHSASWYPSGKLGATLGHERIEAHSGIHSVGRLWGPAETINCFGCHATFVPVDGERIRFDAIEPGVGCARCHWNTRAHVEEMEAGAAATIERLSQLSPQEAVDRCGRCHRRASEMGAPVTADNGSLARFAPVGFVQSPCFQHQEDVLLESGRPARFVCTTCHDPHRTSAGDWRKHVATCLQCHDSAHGRAPDCRVAARDENCLPCHMPTVPANENLSFTDHWIRVRGE